MAVGDGTTKNGLKRKARSKPSSSTKRLKTQTSSLSGLPWKSVARPTMSGYDGDDGILELEEVDDVEVLYEETEAGKVLKFNILEKTDKKGKHDDIENSPDTPEDIEAGIESTTDVPLSSISFDSKLLLPNWHSYSLHPHLLQILHHQGFTTPTPIQSKSLPKAMEGRDIVGVAETGSGKTLAYGLPILHHLLSRSRHPSSKVKRQVQALVLAPTRELALQVSDHLNMFARSIEAPIKEETLDVELSETQQLKDKSKGKNVVSGTAKTFSKPPLVSIAAIVGGMSAQKQRRIIDRGVDILIATPGRLWDILEEDDSLAKQLASLRYLILDEADRMVENGHFAELDNILRLTLRLSREDVIEPEFETQDTEVQAHAETEDALQTFVFSATLSKDLQRDLKKGYRPRIGKKGRSKPASTLEDLVLRLDFRDANPEVIDISPEGGVVSGLQESKIECLSADKDIYLYYFLLRYPGRSLVFLSSIDGIRRLTPLMDLLNVKVFPLHSQLEQRQRLKNLDRFKSTPNSVLLATDIAARGLDIPAVDHVIHYQIPRSADTFIHRNGRTARAMRKGFSLLMCAPDERRVVKALLLSLGRDDADIPEISVELNLLDKLKARVQLARQIDTAQHKIKKANHERTWMKEAAEAMEIELDSDFMSGSDDEGKPSKQQTKMKNAKTAALKAELREMLSQPLVARGISTRYITSGSRPIVDDIIAGEYHDMMLGLKKTEAGNDLLTAKKGKQNKKEKAEPEEWNGFGS